MMPKKYGKNEPANLNKVNDDSVESCVVTEGFPDQNPKGEKKLAKESPSDTSATNAKKYINLQTFEQKN